MVAVAGEGNNGATTNKQTEEDLSNQLIEELAGCSLSQTTPVQGTGAKSSASPSPPAGSQPTETLSKPQQLRKRIQKEVGYPVWFSSLPENASPKHIIGALRKQFGRFQAMNMVRIHDDGVAKVVFSSRQMQGQVLSQRFELFKNRIHTSTERPTRTQLESETNHTVYISEIPGGYNVGDLLRLIRKYIGRFSLTNKVEINGGRAHLRFKSDSAYKKALNRRIEIGRNRYLKVKGKQPVTLGQSKAAATSNWRNQRRKRPARRASQHDLQKPRLDMTTPTKRVPPMQTYAFPQTPMQANWMPMPWDPSLPWDSMGAIPLRQAGHLCSPMASPAPHRIYRSPVTAQKAIPIDDPEGFLQTLNRSPTPASGMSPSSVIFTTQTMFAPTHPHQLYYSPV